MIEDDTQLAKMVAEYLGKMSMVVTMRDTAAAGLSLLQRDSFDAVILDVMLPDLDGFEVCRRLRVSSDVPILMLTARGDDADRIVGLEIGADDYLPKPFNPRELLARLRSILRRARRHDGGRLPTLRVGAIEIDRGARVVRRHGEAVNLTSYQFDLLYALAEQAGRVMTRDSLMTKVRGHDLEAFDRSIDVHISKIRAAIEDDPKHPTRIITIRGIGYTFTKPDAETV